MRGRPARTLADILLITAERTPDAIVLIVDDDEYSYAQLRDCSLSFAATLQAQGLERGDRVAIYMDNTWACAVSIFGVLLSGGVFFVINPQTKAGKLDFLLKDSGAVFLSTDAHLRSVFLEAVVSNTGIRGIICSGPLTNMESRERRVQSFASATETDPPHGQRDPCLSVDLAALIYTSGSTGEPKGIMMSHASMLFTLDSLVEYLRLSSKDRIVNFLPLAFDYGLYQLFMTVRLGALLVLQKSLLYPAQVMNCVRDHEITVFPGVPTVFSLLMGMHRRMPISFPSITRVTNTAAALPAQNVPILREIFPNALIFKMYGVSECKRVCYLEPELLDRHPSSVGKAIPGTETLLLGPDGQPVKAGEEGVLHVRGAHIMRGYWNNPSLSAKMIIDGELPGDRMLCTQDRFRMDEDGLLYFVGRKDEIIKTRGEKVSPLEVEKVILAMPGVQEVAVLGFPDELLGEAIRAFIALESGSRIKERQVQKHCLAHLENFMVPKSIVILDSLPKTANGKIARRVLAKKVSH